MVRTVPEAVAQQHRNTVRILKLNVDDSPAVARRYGITGIPTLILFQDAVEKERIVGGSKPGSQTIERQILPALAKDNVESSSA
jgi:thioredoxin 1